MDYVVAGFGIGAVLALIGFALWELFGNVETPSTSWLGRAAIGLMLGSLVIWSVTCVSLISHIDDSTGSKLVMLTSLVTLVSIAIGAFWYWRADRMMVDSRPRPTNLSVPRAEASASAAKLAGADVELSAWDSWPERETADVAQPGAEEPESEPRPSFEPEVAVEPELTPEIQTGSDVPEATKDETAVVLPQDTAPTDPVAHEEMMGPELPSNLRQLPPAGLTGSSDQVIAQDGFLAEAVDPAPPEVVVEEEAPIEDTKVDDTALVSELEAPTSPDEEQEQPQTDETDGTMVAFQSSLLLDVDGSLAEEEGYRSPLLSDLGSDQLEGVGLAKWRPDARLTGQEDEESPLPENTNRRS